MKGASTMTILEYLTGLAIILGSLIGIMGLAATVMRHRQHD
jgi:cytosine/uracil/thiamine/allantoin permease